MKIIILLFIFSLQGALAAPMVNTVVDYLRETPAAVWGSLKVESEMTLYKGKKSLIDIGLKIKPNQSLQYSFGEDYLRINTSKALVLTIQGMPLKVNSIEYSEKTGKFLVKTDTPLNIGERELNAEVEKVLNTQFKAKIIRAFNQLKSLRSQKSLNDSQAVLKSIIGIFVSPSTAGTSPQMSGELNLSFNPPKNRNLQLDQWKAQIKAGDNVQFGMKFRVKDKGMKITGVNFSSAKGIRLSGNTKFPEIASVNFRSLDASRAGIEFQYDVGAEEVLTGFRILLTTISAYSGNSNDVAIECDPVRLQAIRDSLDDQLKKEIAAMIKTYRAQFLKAGVSKQLLNALD